MPSSSIDTFLACSIMIILALSAIMGTSKLMAPYLNDLSHRDDAERFQQLASHILLNTGTPANWGQMKNTAPNSLGFARADSSQPYELDVDKVSRLNSGNIYSLTYAELWEALGVKDVTFQIEIKPVFELSIDLISNSTLGNATVYEFEVAAKKFGMPIVASLNGYVVVESYVGRASSSTSSNGIGSLTVTIPNSVNGTALLLVFARADVNAQMVSFNTYTFSHNASTPLPNGTFARLSPLNHVLNASQMYSASEIVKAQVFSFNYNFSLTVKTLGSQTTEYFVPSLLDSSPLIMVLTGHNGSTSFAEWVSYPLVPLQVGVDFSHSIAGSKIVSLSHIVTIDSVLYQAVTKWGEAD